MIRCYNSTTETLRLTRCGDEACGPRDLLVQSVDNVGKVGWTTSVQIDLDGRPIIAYWDQTLSAVKVTVLPK